MANTLGSLVVSLGLDAAQFTSGMTKAEYQAQKTAREVISNLEKIKTAANTLLGALGLGISFTALEEGFRAISEAAAQDERSLNQLNTVLNATKGVAGLTAEQLGKVADELHRSSTFDDTSIRSAEVILLRFRDIQADIFKDAIKLGPDLAAVLGTDLPAAVQVLGRALTGSSRDVRALREAGLSLSTTQEDLRARMKETGDVAGAQRLLIDELTKSIAGSGEADTKGLYGATKGAARAWTEFKSTLGERFLNDSFTRGLTDLMNRWSNFIKSGSPEVGAPVPGKGAREASGIIGGAAFPGNQEDIAAGKAADQAAQQAADAARLREYERLKARAADADAFYGKDLALQKSYLEAKNLQESFAYSRGEMTTEQFYDNERVSAARSLEDLKTNLGKRAEALDALAKNTHTTAEERTALEQRISTLDRQMTVETAANANKLILINQAETKSFEALGDQAKEVAAQIAEMNGKSAEATRIRQSTASEQITRRQVGPQEDVLNKQKEAQSELNDATLKYSNTLEAVGIAQARIDIEQQTSAISEITALNKKSDIARNYIPILREEIDALQKIVDGGTLGAKDQDAAILRIARMRLEIDQLASSTDALGQKFSDAFGSAFADQLTAVADGTKSVKQGILDLGKAWVHVINEIAAKEIASQLFGKGGAAGGFGSLLASLFGGGAGGSQFTEGSANFVGPIAGAAGGTDYAQGGLMKVGEYGTELVNLPRGSQVIPHDRLLAARQARSGGDINVTVNMPRGVSRQTGAQFGAEAARALSYAGRST